MNQEKSANEVTEEHGSLASDPRNSDLHHAHMSLVARLDRIVAHLHRAGIKVGEGPVAIDAADKTNQLALPGAELAPAIDEGTGSVAGVVSKPTTEQLAQLSDEELWQEADRRQAAKRIQGSPLAFYGQDGNSEKYEQQEASK
jgi:hypothetical protein